MADPASTPGQPADGVAARRAKAASPGAGGGSIPVPDVVAAVCPFLVASDGAWRAASASREHRCGATDPLGRLPLERQASLCLAVAHLDCPLFEAATGPTGGSQARRAAVAAAELDPNAVSAAAGETSREARAGDTRPPAFVQLSRANPRTTPVIIDRARSPLDVHLPQIHLPAVASRKATSATGGTGVTVDEAGATSGERATAEVAATSAADGAAMRRRLQELRDARTRARGQGRAASLAARVNVVDPMDRPDVTAQGGGDADVPSERSSARPGWSARLSGLLGSPARRAPTAGLVRRPPAHRLPAESGSGTPTEPAAERAGPRRSSIPAGTGGSWRSPAGIRAAMSGRQVQAALAGLMALALVLVLVVRFSGGGSTTGVPGAASSAPPSAAPTVPQSGGNASPAASSVATGSVAPSNGPASSPAPSGSATPPTTAPTAGPTPKPTKSPAAARTYRVRSGDTLSAIAARFKTTVAILMRLNKITDPGTLRIGQILKLP